MVQYAHREEVEKDRSKNTALLHTIGDIKKMLSVTITEHDTHHAIVKELKDLNEFSGTPKLCENDLENFSADCIKSLG